MNTKSYSIYNGQNTPFYTDDCENRNWKNWVYSVRNINVY